MPIGRTSFDLSPVGGLYVGSPYSLALPTPLMNALGALASQFSLTDQPAQDFSEHVSSETIEFDLRGIVRGLLGHLDSDGNSPGRLAEEHLLALMHYAAGDDVALANLISPLQALVATYGVELPADLSASSTRNIITTEDMGAARRALFAPSLGALPTHVLKQLEELKVALGSAETAVKGLQNARLATADQGNAINGVWMALARLDRMMDVEAYKGSERIGEVKSLIASAEKFLDDLCLKPMAADALVMRENKARYYLTAPGQANEAIDFLRTVYHRSKAAQRFVDEVIVPALKKYNIHVDQLVDPSYELSPAIRAHLGGSKISQPLILATQMAALEEMKSFGYDPHYFKAAIGDSQGTLLALVAGGYVDPAEAIETVAINGIGMDTVSRFYNGKVSMISVLGMSRKELNQLSLAVNLHVALMSGVEGEFAGLTGAEKQELTARFQDQLLYGNLLPVSKMIEDEELRERFKFLKKLHARAYFVEQAQAQLMGLPEDLNGLEEIAHLLMNGKAKTTYPTLVHSPDDGDRALGVPPSVILSGHDETNRLMLSILGNKGLKLEPHASVKMVGYNFDKSEEVIYPKTTVLPTSAPFHHFGYMLASQQNIIGKDKGVFRDGFIPVYVNSVPFALNDLKHPDGTPFTAREKKVWVLQEQHTRNVRLERSLDAMVSSGGDQELPIVMIDVGPDAIEDKFNREILGGRATCLAWGKGGYERLTSRKPIQFEAEQAPLKDPKLYQPVEKQVSGGRPVVNGEYLGPLAALPQVHLAVDSERKQLMADIERVVDFSGDAPKWKEDPFLKANGSEGPFGMAAMTGPGSAKLTGAVARQSRHAFLAFGNYPPQAYRGVSIEDAALAGIIDTAWETTRATDPLTGLPVDKGSLSYDGELHVRGNLDSYGDRALEDQQLFEEGEGKFTGPMKPFGANYMHATIPQFRCSQVSAHVRALDMGIPMNKASIGLYQATPEELRLYIPLLARGVIYLPLLANLTSIEKYQSEQIEFLKAELKKYFEGGWKTYNQEMAAVMKEKYGFDDDTLPVIFRTDRYHQNLQSQKPEYFKDGGFDAFMKANASAFGKGREGNDGGGHNAPDGTPTYRLMQAAIREARAAGNKEKVPNIAAGGFSDGVALADAKLSFASGVMAGTIFEITEESDLPYGVKQIFMQAADPTHERSYLNTTSEYGKPLNAIENAFALTYRDLIATDNAENLLTLLQREPRQSIKLHREFWNRGIETQDPSLGLVLKNKALFETIWNYLEGKTENRAEVVAAIARLVKEDHDRAKTKFDAENAKPEVKEKKVWNPLRDNPKDQLITFYRVFRTNMVQHGKVDPEWSYLLGGRSLTHMPEKFIKRFKETGQLPTVKELIETVEADALNYLAELYRQAKQVEWERGQTYPTRTFDRLPGVSYEKLPLAEGGDVLRVSLSGNFSQATTAQFKKAARAQGYGPVAHVMRSIDLFDRFLTPHTGREFVFHTDSTNPNHPELLSVKVIEGGRVVADLTHVDGAVVLTRHMMVNGQERLLKYVFEKKEVRGAPEWVLDQESLQKASAALFDEQLTGTLYDHGKNSVTTPIDLKRPAGADKVGRYNALVGEGYKMFVQGNVAHPGYVAVQSLDAGVHASTHPDYRADRGSLLHGYIEQSFGAPLPIGPDFNCQAKNISAKPTEEGRTEGAFTQDMHVISRDAQGHVISEVTTGFVNRDPNGKFPQNLDVKVDSVLKKDNGGKLFKGFDRYAIFQAFTVVTRQEIRDYEEFDANSIHHVDFDAQMGGLEKGIISQGMLVRGKMMSHMIAGYLKGNQKRLVSEKTTWTGTVNPDEQLSLVLYREGQQGNQDHLVFEATDSNGKVVMKQEWVVERDPQIVLIPGQGTQEAGMWKKVTERYTPADDAKPQIKTAYKRAAEAQKKFLKEVDDMSLAEWGFKLSDIEAHNQRTFSFTITEEGHPSGKVGERVTLRNKQGVLSETDIAQPALIVSYLLDIMGAKELGILHDNADYVHNSLGKIASLAASGAISFLDAVRLARARGRVMSSVRGAFATTVANQPGVWEIVEKEAAKVRNEMGEGYEVYATNNNSSRQAGFAGTEAGVEELVSRLVAKSKDLGLDKDKTERLVAIVNPFHTPLYEEAANQFFEILKTIDINEEVLSRVFLNSTGKRFDPATDDIRKALANQIMKPVRVEANLVNAAKERPGANMLELGGHASILSKFAIDTLPDHGVPKAPVRSSVRSWDALTYKKPDDKIEVKAPPAAAKAAAVSTPVATEAAPQAAPQAQPQQQPKTQSQVEYRYLKPVAPGSPEYKEYAAIIGVMAGKMLFDYKGLYTTTRKPGGIETLSEGFVGTLAKTYIVPLGPGAIEGIQAEIKRREEIIGSTDAATAQQQQFIISVLSVGLSALKEIKTEMEKTQGGASIDLKGPEFAEAWRERADVDLPKMGFLRDTGHHREHETFEAEVAADGTISRPGEAKTKQLTEEAKKTEAATSKRFIAMTQSEYQGRRFYFDTIQHNGAKDNVLEFAETLRAHEEEGEFELLAREIPKARRTLANQLDKTGIAIIETLIEEWKGMGGLEKSIQALRDLIAETRESLAKGLLPPYVDFDMTTWEPLYGTEQKSREVSRNITPEEYIKEMISQAEQAIALAYNAPAIERETPKWTEAVHELRQQIELGKRMLELVAGKTSLKGERVLVLGSGTISKPFISYLLSQGAQVVVTTTRKRSEVNNEFSDMFRCAARGASLEVKTEFGFNPMNYVKLVDEMRIDGFAPTMMISGAAVDDYSPFNKPELEDWHGVSEALVRAPLYVSRKLAQWYLGENNGVHLTIVDLGSPAAKKPMAGSGSYQFLKHAFDNEEWVDHTVDIERMIYPDGTRFASLKQMVVPWTNPGPEATKGLMLNLRVNSGRYEAATRALGTRFFTFNGQTVAAAVLGLCSKNAGISERMGLPSGFDDPKLDHGGLDRVMEKVNEDEAKKHKDALATNGGKYLTFAQSLRYMADVARRDGNVKEADSLMAEAKAYEANQELKKKREAAHPMNYGQLYRVWNGSFYIRDKARGIDTFNNKRHVESKDDDLDITGLAATGPYGRTIFGNYRNALSRFKQDGEWGGADWQELVKYMDPALKIPTNLTAEEYSTGKAPDGKSWRDKIFGQAGIRELEHLIRHRRRESEKLNEEITIVVSPSNKKKIKMHKEAGHKIIGERAFNTVTGEYEYVYGIIIPKGEDMLAWVIQSLNVTTLADLVGGTENYFAKITGILEPEKAIRAYATIMSRIGNSDLQRFMGMNAIDIHNEITAGAIQSVVGIGMVDFYPTEEMMVAPTQAEATHKSAIPKAIPNAVSEPKIDQWGAGGESTTTSEACATGPGALEVMENNYYAARDKFAQAYKAYIANPMGEKMESALFQAWWDFQMTLHLAWSVDHANSAANVQAFDSLSTTGAMVQKKFITQQGIDPALALASHNQEADGFVGGVMMGAVSAMPKRLKKRLGLKSVARMVRITGSTDFQKNISKSGTDRTETAPGIEGQVFALIKLMNALVLKGISLKQIMVWVTHSTGTMGDGEQSKAIRMAFEIAEASEGGLSVEVFAKQIFGHGLGGTMFEQCMAFMMMHYGYTLGQPSLNRLIRPTAENPYMFPTRKSLNIFKVRAKDPARAVAGSNFGFHGENRIWSAQATSDGFDSVEESVDSLELQTIREARSIIDQTATKAGKMNDIVNHDTPHADPAIHAEAKFMLEHARTIALMIVDQELNGKTFDFDMNLYREVLAYEAALIRHERGEHAILPPAHQRAAKALAGATPEAAQRRAPDTTLPRNRQDIVSQADMDLSYQAWGEGTRELVDSFGVDQATVKEMVRSFKDMWKVAGTDFKPPSDLYNVIKNLLTQVGQPKVALMLTRRIAALSERYGDNPQARTAASLWLFDKLKKRQLDQLEWARLDEMWRTTATRPTAEVMH